MKRIIFIGLSIFIFSAHVHGETLFTETFDDQPDWFPQTEEEGCSDLSCVGNLPAGWNYYRNDELWHPLTDGDGFNPTLQISNTNFMGMSGKSLTIWNESNNGRSGDGWGADGILAKDLGADYQELYVSMYIQFKPGFQFYATEANSAAIKMLRVSHWDRVGSPFSFFSGGNSAPIYIYDTSQSTTSFRHFHSYRCDPQADNYYCTPSYDKSYTFPGAPAFTESLGDGEWHRLDWHIKNNSAPGIADGVLEFFVDSILALSRSDIVWMGSGSPGGIGWNIVAFGGNSYNLFSDPANMAEQWYAIDNIKISTTPLLLTLRLSPGQGRIASGTGRLQ